MPNPRKSFWQSLLDFIASLFGGGMTPESTQASLSSDSPDEPAEVTVSKVLLIVYDPVMDESTGQKLSAQQGWGSVEELATGYIA